MSATPRHAQGVRGALLITTLASVPHPRPSAGPGHDRRPGLDPRRRAAVAAVAGVRGCARGADGRRAAAAAGRRVARRRAPGVRGRGGSARASPRALAAGGRPRAGARARGVGAAQRQAREAAALPRGQGALRRAAGAWRRAYRRAPAQPQSAGGRGCVSPRRRFVLYKYASLFPLPSCLQKQRVRQTARITAQLCSATLATAGTISGTEPSKAAAEASNFHWLAASRV